MNALSSIWADRSRDTPLLEQLFERARLVLEPALAEDTPLPLVQHLE